MPMIDRIGRRRLKRIDPGWSARGAERKGGTVANISCDCLFKNFKHAMAFADRVGKIAEEQQHHRTCSLPGERCA